MHLESFPGFRMTHFQDSDVDTPSWFYCGRRMRSQGGVQVQLGQPPESSLTEEKKGEVSEVERKPALSRKTSHAFSGQVVAAAYRLRRVLYHLSAVRGPGFLQHRAAGGGETPTGHWSPEAGVSEPELRQRGVARTVSLQSADGQQARRLRAQKCVAVFKLGLGILHVLRQHSGHNCRWVKFKRKFYFISFFMLATFLRMTQEKDEKKQLLQIPSQSNVNTVIRVHKWCRQSHTGPFLLAWDELILRLYFATCRSCYRRAAAAELLPSVGSHRFKERHLRTSPAGIRVVNALC